MSQFKSAVPSAMALWCLIIGPGVAYASTDSGIPIVITPTRFEQPVNQVISPTSIITHKQIQSTGASTVADVLRFFPDFSVKQLGGPGQQTSIFMQGTNSGMVKVLINGVSINDPLNGSIPWSQIPADQIERIEVVSGPLSTLWGSDAIGGVINIITRQPHGNGGSMTMGAGDWGASEGGAAFHGQKGKALFGLSISGQRTGGQQIVEQSPKKAPFYDRVYTAYGRTSWHHGGMKINFWQSRGQSAYLSYPLLLSSQDFLSQTMAIAVEHQILPSWRMELKFKQSRNQLWQNQLDSLVTPPQDDYAQSIRNEEDGVITYHHHGMSLVGGVMSAKESARSLNYGTQIAQYRSLQAIYAEWQKQFSILTLIGSGRHTVDSQFGDHDTWNAGVALTLPHNMRLAISTGTGYRAPTFEQLYGYGGNAALKPETSRSIEIKWSITDILGQVSLVGYQHQLSNLIESVPKNNYVYTNINTDSKIKGIVMSWSKIIHPFWVEMDATWQDPRNLGNNQSLIQRPHHLYKARLIWMRDRWHIGVAWLYEGGRLAYNGTQLSPYRLLNFEASYALLRRLSVRLKIHNVLDARYDTGLYAPGNPYLGARRSWLLSFRYRLGSV